jgi:DNA-binding transcriptional MerR regulator
VETVRYYERVGLLPRATRGANRYRSYTPLAAVRLHFVRRCRSLGMSLADIAELLGFYDEPGRDCADVDRIIANHLAHVVRKLAELKALAGALRGLRFACREQGLVGRCAILQALTRTVGDGAGDPESSRLREIHKKAPVLRPAARRQRAQP